MNELGYTGDAIIAKAVTFPQNKQYRPDYAQAVHQAVQKLDQKPLSWMQQLETTVINQVGVRRLDKVDKRFSHLSTRYYLWAQANPKWAMALNIASLGATILLQKNGKANYDKSQTLFPLVEALDTLKTAIKVRERQIKGIEQTILDAVRDNTEAPEEWVESLDILEWNGKSKEFYKSLRTRFVYNHKIDLSDSTVYTNERRYQAMHTIYERLQCADLAVNLKATKQVYTDSRDWKNLQPDIQAHILQRMMQHPERYKPLFDARIAELLHALEPAAFCACSESARQTIRKQVHMLGLNPGSSINRAFEALKAHIVEKALKECSWTEEATSHLRGICADLKLSAEFDKAYILHKLSWNGMYKLSRLDRKAVIEQACFLMADEDMADSMEKAFSALRNHILVKALPECSWTEPETEYFQGLCEDLGMIPDFIRACTTSKIEGAWPDVGFLERIDNTKDIMNDVKHYEPVLERRRKEVFALAKSSETLPFNEWVYVVNMLRTLLPQYEQGCRIELRYQKERLLSSMVDKVLQNDEEIRKDFAKRAEILGLDPKILADLSDTGSFNAFYMYLQSGKRHGQRLLANIHESLIDERMQLRRIGCPTQVVRVPTPEDMAQLAFVQEHLLITVPAVPKFSGKADLMQLMKYLYEADKRGLIPNILLRPKDDGTNQPLAKKAVLDSLKSWLTGNIAKDKGYDLIVRAKNILMHYVVTLQERFKACKTKEEEREIYVEIVELVGKEMGFAYYACNDRKYNAAMMIYNEKLALAGVQNDATEQKVQMWVAKKRSDFVTAMLHEMIHEYIKYYGSVDIASAIGYWRCQLADEFGLGDVPVSQYSLVGGLTRSQIVDRFSKTYTPQWLIGEAMAEHGKENGVAVLKISAINDFLNARLTNYDVLRYDLLDEDNYKLLECGMALYLQEAGVFKAVV